MSRARRQGRGNAACLAAHEPGQGAWEIASHLPRVQQQQQQQPRCRTPNHGLRAKVQQGAGAAQAQGGFLGVFDELPRLLCSLAQLLHQGGWRLVGPA